LDLDLVEEAEAGLDLEVDLAEVLGDLRLKTTKAQGRTRVLLIAEEMATGAILSLAEALALETLVREILGGRKEEVLLATLLLTVAQEGNLFQGVVFLVNPLIEGVTAQDQLLVRSMAESETEKEAVPLETEVFNSEIEIKLASLKLTKSQFNDFL
jgi:hypothetical protein